MIVAAALLVAVVAVPSSPSLCIGTTCREVSGSRIEIAPAAEPRRFVWISAASAEVIAGDIPAQASIVPLRDEGRARHRMTLATSDGARNVAPLFELRCDESVWTWSIAQLPRAAIEIAHPAGACSLTVRANGYKAAVRQLTTPGAGTMYLHRLPVITGTVIDAVTRTPVRAADVLLPSGERLAMTDDHGRFRAHVDGPWPARLRVQAPAWTMKTVVVPTAVADVDLQILLSAGGSIAVTLEPPLQKEPLRWEVRRIVNDSDDEKVRSGEVPSGQSTFTIEALEPGPYRVLMSGEGPLQRYVVPVMVNDGAVAAAAVRIESSRLELEILREGQPLAEAEVELVFRDGDAAWRTKVVADEQGRSIEEIWQSGEYLAGVAGWTETRHLAGGETIAWRLDVPDRVIRGRVVDAVSGQPLGNALLSLETIASDARKLTRMQRSGNDGRYEFKAVPVGSYAISVRADGYEMLATPRVPLAEATRVETRDLRMQTVSGHTLRVVSALGVPLPGAAVWIATPAGVRAVGLTREDGRVILPLAMHEAGEAFAFPRSGSFGVTRFRAIAEEGVEELSVTIPDGVASLEMLTVTTNGDPIARVPFIMRVNGVVVPGPIYEAMTRYQGLPLWSDDAGRALLSRLPPGRYEIWPLTSAEDRRAVESPAPPPAPVNVMLTPGHHAAKLTFKPRA